MTLPGMTDLMKQDRKIGLASEETDGRKKALDFLFAANQAVKKLNRHHGRQAVLAIQIHSTPAGLGHRDPFVDSLDTILSWDWEGAKILVEHCDRFKTDGSHRKGYLSLEDEILAVEKITRNGSQTPLAFLLNWDAPSSKRKTPITFSPTSRP